VDELFACPRHPYTRGLLNSIPRLGGDAGQARLAEIPGMVPSLREALPGCAFAPRCDYATDVCRNEAPPLEEKAARHFAACWHSERVVNGRGSTEQVHAPSSAPTASLPPQRVVFRPPA
jgi:peptide/nickel transport system ATP-binding protein